MKRLITALVFFCALPVAAADRPLAAQAFPEPMPRYLASIISDAASRYNVDPNLIAAMTYKESRFNPNAVSWRGAQGLMQLMPRTAKALGVTNSFDPQQNVMAGTKYIAQLLNRFNGNIDMAVAAYNAGPELVQRVGPAATHEAVDYVAAVKSFYQAALAAL